MTEPRTRRPPPPFRRVTVRRTERLTPRLNRVTLSGPELEGFPVPEPAASVRLLLPTPDGLVLPEWTGNLFVLPDGSRAPIRTFTPRRFDPDALELDVDVVLHGSGLASRWAETVTPGDQAAISGPGRGYGIDPHAEGFWLLGDETAIPAISQLLEYLPDVPIRVDIEVANPAARLDLPRDTDEHWYVLDQGASPGDALVAAVRSAGLPPGVRVWAAGEAAAMQRIRRHLFDERGLERSLATVRGYWKAGRTA